MSIQNVLSDNDDVGLIFPASLAVSRGDLMYWNSGTHQPYPLTSKATLASEVLDQADVVSKFVGVAWDTRLVSETSTGSAAVRVAQLNGVFDADCPSQIFYPGDLVGPTWNGGAALVNQYVTKVNNIFLAIGIVCDPYNRNYDQSGNAITRVRFRLISRFCFDLLSAKPGVGGSQGVGATTLADTAITLTPASNPFINQVPTTARNITLPVETQSAGLVFYFTNNSGGANTVTFLASGGGSIKGNGAVPQNKTAVLWNDGTNWNGCVST